MDTDKSRILLGILDKHKEIVIKIGDSDELEREYNYGRMLFSSKGFVKHICYFSCNDDHLTLPDPARNTLPGREMGVLLMPYFPMGSLANYKWTNINLHVLHSCIKHAVASVLFIFCKVHGDFHPGNVLLKDTKQKSITYELYDIGTIEVPTHGIRTWIMDYETMDSYDGESMYEKMIRSNKFYFDLNRFFMLLGSAIPAIDTRTLVPIQMIINKHLMDSTLLTYASLNALFEAVDSIAFV